MALELYVFGSRMMAERAGFRLMSDKWRHVDAPDLRAFILGQHWPEEIRGEVWSRVTITESAEYQAHHFDHQAVALEALRLRVRPMLRLPPMLWIEL